MTVEKLMERLSVDRETAEAYMLKARVYSNAGKGKVFKNTAIIQKLGDMLRQQPDWFNFDLNRELGWQFSQAVFYLREEGWNIDTIKLTNGVYVTHLISVPVLVS